MFYNFFAERRKKNQSKEKEKKWKKNPGPEGEYERQLDSRCYQFGIRYAYCIFYIERREEKKPNSIQINK